MRKLQQRYYYDTASCNTRCRRRCGIHIHRRRCLYYTTRRPVRQGTVDYTQC